MWSIGAEEKRKGKAWKGGGIEAAVARLACLLLLLLLQ